MNSESAETPGLFRTWIHDGKLGIKRLVWALDSECPICERGFISIYADRGKPDRGDVLLIKVSPCRDCIKDYERTRKRKARTKRRTKKRKRSKKR